MHSLTPSAVCVLAQLLHRCTSCLDGLQLSLQEADGDGDGGDESGGDQRAPPSPLRAAFACLLERAPSVRRAARWAWRREALGAEEVAAAVVRQLVAAADVVVTAGGGAAAAAGEPDPILQGLNVLLSAFEDESEGEGEGEAAESGGFDDGSDDEGGGGGWQWESDGEGEAVGPGA